VNDLLSDLVKFQTCMIIYRHQLKCKFFVGLCENTHQQTCLKVQHYCQNKDRTAASPIAPTPHNEGTVTQQSGVPNLFKT
jgi:hypothetical protein